MSISHHIYHKALPGATHFLFVPSIFGSAETIDILAETVKAPHGLSYLDIRSHIQGLTMFRWQALIQETEDALATVDLSNTVLIGFSLGGFLIQSMLMRERIACRGFVLWSSGHGLPPTLLWRVARRAEPMLSQAWINRLLFKASQKLLHLKSGGVARDMRALSPELTLQVIAELRHLDFSEFLMQTELPFLANRDRFDYVLPPVTQEICRMRGNVVDIPYSGHGLWVSGQVRFAEAIVRRFGQG